MSLYFFALFTLLVTGHLAMTGIVSLLLISPLLLLSLVVVTGHTYACSIRIFRHVVSVHNCYETVNFYDPGYKTYSDRYVVALCQIALELLRKKIEELVGGRNSANQATNCSENPLPFDLLQLQPERSTIYVIGAFCTLIYFAFCLAIHATRCAIAWLVGMCSSLSIPCGFTSIMVSFGVVLVMVWVLGTRRGTIVAYIRSLQAKQRLSTYLPVLLELAIAAYIVPHIFLLGIQQVVISKSIARWTRKATEVPRRVRVESVAKPTPQKLVPRTRDTTVRYEDVGFGGKIMTKDERRLKTRPSYPGEFALPPVESGQSITRVPTSSSHNRVPSAQLHVPEEPRLAIAAPTGRPLPSPSTSAGSLPGLSSNSGSPNTSAGIGTPTGQFTQIVIDSLTTAPSRQSPFCTHGYIKRGQIKNSPMQMPKDIGKPYATIDEDKTAAMWHRLEWKQRTRLMKEQRQAKAARESRSLLVADQMAMSVGVAMDSSVMPTGPVEVAAEVGHVVEPQGALGPSDPTLAQPPVEFPPQVQVPPPSTQLVGVPEVVERKESVGDRGVKNATRRSLAARSTGTDAPPASGEVSSIPPTLPSSSPAPPLLGSAPSASTLDAAAPTPTSTPTLTPTSAPTPTPSASSSTTKRSRDDSPERLPKQTKTCSAPEDIAPALTAQPETLSRMLKSALYYPEPTLPSRPTTTVLEIPKVAGTTGAAPKTRVAPVYTLLESDGSKRILQKGDVIPPRRQYTVRDERGTRMMTAGSKPVRV